MFRGSLVEEETIKVEILEFKTADNLYGIDINDIKEILPYKLKLTPIPNSHPAIEGIIMPRDIIIPVVNLAECLKLPKSPIIVKHMLIVSEVNDINVAFHVESVKGIHKVTDQQIQKDNDKVSTNIKGVVAEIVNIGDDKIEVLNLKKIISLINPDSI
jgi:two-component system chemotaxis response regulator CheV